MISNEELRRLALMIANDYSVEETSFVVTEHLCSYEWYGKLYSKGRPRFSGKGHAYTPANTRKYEKTLKDFFIDNTTEIIYCPIAIKLEMFDPMPKSMNNLDRRIAMNGLTYSTRGDIDNRQKAIFDAGNGIVYADDSQIVEVVVSREYGRKEGFRMSIQRVGLSDAEAHNLSNICKELARKHLWIL